MKERERPQDNRGGGSPDSSPDSGDALASIADAGSRMLAAADNAISRGLSRDSTAFLNSIRQQGGQ